MQYPDIFFKRRGWLCQYFMVFIMCFLFLGGNASAANTAPTQSMATCLYDVVEDLLPEYFSPKAKTELWDLNDGSIAFGRSYPSNPYQSGLMIVGNDVYYSLFGKWTYYNTFDFSDNNFAGGKCRSQVEAYACSTPLVSNPASSTSLGSKTIEPQGVVQKSKLWPNGSTLNVAFDFQGQDLRGSATCSTTQSVSACETMIKAEVIKAASIWSQYGNIKFNFDTPWNNGDIRIRFRFEGGGYSLVGIDARSTSKSQETMMLGVSIGLTGTTIHEFGHAIGFHHEHQNPSVAYHWNKNEVYSYMERTQNPPWSHEQTDSNILNPLDKTGITKTDLFNTDYDPKSIMVYFIPSQWVSAADKANPAVCPSTKAQWCVEDNTGTLSELDKWTVAQVYPFQVSCNYTVSPSTFSIVASGKSGLSSTVNTQNTCSWTASSNTSWITLSNTSGQGSGQISYNVAPNTSTSSRTGVINVSGQSITITQAGVTAVACSYTVSPTQASNIAATGQSGLSVAINAQSSCTWTASSNVGWITLSNVNGQGNGQINYSVASNTSTSPRTGVINVGGQSVSVTQAGANASFNASLNVKYEYNTPACQAPYTVLVQQLFTTQGVNQSDLMYVQSEPTVYEEKLSVGSQGLGRAFCAGPGWKTTFSVRLREISTGKLSNIMTTPIDTTVPASAGTFNASLKNITYTYSPSSCSAQFPVVVQMFFDTTGVSQSNLIYVESQPSVSESNVSLTSQGLVRSFCTTNGWKTPLSFRLKDSSTGKLSNMMTAALDTTVPVSTTPLSINISGQLNSVTLLPATGASDSGNQTISGMSQNRTFYLASGQKASILVSGQINKIYISNRIAGNVSYSSSGQANEVFRID